MLAASVNFAPDVSICTAVALASSGHSPHGLCATQHRVKVLHRICKTNPMLVSLFTGVLLCGVLR